MSITSAEGVGVGTRMPTARLHTTGSGGFAGNGSIVSSPPEPEEDLLRQTGGVHLSVPIRPVARLHPQGDVKVSEIADIVYRHLRC